MYHNTVGGQWLDYSGGLIFGKRFNKHIGVFLEGDIISTGIESGTTLSVEQTM